MSGPITGMDEPAGADTVGGKAAALMRLAAKGFDVPPFLVVQPSAFNARGMLPAHRTALLDRLPTLGPGPYAARSSAREEDGANHSHAGQFLSVLSLDAKKVPAACARVFKSGLAEVPIVRGARSP